MVDAKEIAKRVRAFSTERVHVSTYDERGYALEVNAYPKELLLTKAGGPTALLGMLCRQADTIQLRAE